MHTNTIHIYGKVGKGLEPIVRTHTHTNTHTDTHTHTQFLFQDFSRVERDGVMSQ